jgi:USP8 dimerisation domain
MKYVQLVSHIRKTKEYNKDKKYFDAMLPNGKMMKTALERAGVNVAILFNWRCANIS